MKEWNTYPPQSVALRGRILSPVLISADMQKELKQAVCKTVALGPCWFKSNSADYMPQSLKWWRSCLLNSWSVIPACGFEPRLWRYMRVCANRAGSLSRKQVDPKGSEGSNPSILAFTVTAYRKFPPSQAKPHYQRPTSVQCTGSAAFHPRSTRLRCGRSQAGF